MSMTTRDGGPERYLKSSSMVALQKSMQLAATVIGLDIVELWSLQTDKQMPSDDDFHCTYVEATPAILAQYPDVIAGYYPQHTRKHTVSPQLCRQALDNKTGYYWHTLMDGEDQTIPIFKTSAQTEVAYLLQGQELPFHVFIVGFALKKIDFNVSKIKFLSGIGYAIYVTAFVDSKGEDLTGHSGELDQVVKGSPKRQKRETSDDRMDLSEEEVVAREPSIHPSEAYPAGSAPVDSPSVKMAAMDLHQQQPHHQLPVVSVFEPHQVAPRRLLEEFEYPVERLPVLNEALVHSSNLDRIKEITHFADGSNSNIYSAKLGGETVVVKMIKKAVANDPVALLEFDAEESILCRLSHRNIIRFLGGGSQPRRYIVMEWLAGGTLNSLMNKNMARKGITQGLFRQPTFTYAEILVRARDIAEALDYLHTRVHPDVTIIHRDLKPDNVGFGADGSLKLLDMGLSICVKRRTDPTTTYNMTGNTGSLRYMAPEVALRRPYNEKVDVYSFGIMVWQMATDSVPFKGMSREQFMSDVVFGKLRPKLDNSWPVGFCNLLLTCWNHEASARPTFSAVVADLTALLEELDGRGWPKKGRSIRKAIGGIVPQLAEGSDPQSSWF